SLRPDNFPRLNRVNHPGGVPNSVAKATQPSSVAASSSGAPSSSRALQKNPSSVQSSNQRQGVDDFPALPTAQKQGQASSAWVGKKSSKSVIVGCKMPNRTLPQPDVWPEISTTTPAREIEPEQWQE
ncbi:hypothetical protein OSTOST_09087, partial [Ostertagia ostertagi]